MELFMLPHIEINIWFSACFKRIGLLIFSERKKERKREKGKHQFVAPLIHAFIGWFLCVPSLGTELRNLGVWGPGQGLWMCFSLSFWITHDWVEENYMLTKHLELRSLEKRLHKAVKQIWNVILLKDSSQAATFTLISKAPGDFDLSLLVLLLCSTHAPDPTRTQSNIHSFLQQILTCVEEEENFFCPSRFFPLV